MSFYTRLSRLLNSKKKPFIEYTVVRRTVRKSIAGTANDYAQFRLKAQEFVNRRMIELNREYGFEYRRVTIKNQKTRWGSCSSKKNINIHYRIIHLRPELADYVLIHELCHLQEMNHSKAFWALIARTMPNYAQLRAELRALP